MAKADFDTLVTQLGDLRERARRLADEDYISAKYKGYSSEGLTLEEVMGHWKKLKAKLRNWSVS